MDAVAAVVLAYVAGSVPFAFLLARRRGVDLRTRGSGNVGAANVLRTSGVGAAVAAVALDALKGTVAVLVAQRLTSGAAEVMAAGVVSVLGHVYPVWLRFRGGKGVATAAGVFVVLAPVALGAAVIMFVAVVRVTRFVSLGSMAAAVTLPILSAALGGPASVTAGAVLTAAIIVHRHRANLSRVLAGTERRVGERARK
jgi:glycerol-3-phosphate acyltransferase PlsY